jgi:CheY-like chemotaxis protein
MIESAAVRGAELTNRLLAFARRQPLEPKRVDVNRLVGGMESLLRRTLPESISIEFVRSGGLWASEIDPTQLETALLNLALNARDAMPDGGHLTIETANAVLDDAYASQHAEVEPGQYVVIAVSDSGTGMSEDVLARVFDPFFTTKPVGQGSGLGMSMVFGFVKQSRGHAKVYSEAARGTTVKLYFPRSYVPGETAMPTASDASEPGGHEHILVVEDEPSVREHVQSMLAVLGYRTTGAGTGPEALEIVEKVDDIDLLFTDVVMPGGMDGRELADLVFRVRPDIPVLFTSGYTENAIVHHGRLDPGREFLQKPYRRRDLALKLRKILDPS